MRHRGRRCGQAYRRLQVEDMAKAVIADAFAGAAVEQVCAKAEEIIKKNLTGNILPGGIRPGTAISP